MEKGRGGREGKGRWQRGASGWVLGAAGEKAFIAHCTILRVLNSFADIIPRIGNGPPRMPPSRQDLGRIPLRNSHYLKHPHTMIHTCTHTYTHIHSLFLSLSLSYLGSRFFISRKPLSLLTLRLFLRCRSCIVSRSSFSLGDFARLFWNLCLDVSTLYGLTVVVYT